jgi:hypothetical protein
MVEAILDGWQPEGVTMPGLLEGGTGGVGAAEEKTTLIPKKLLRRPYCK